MNATEKQRYYDARLFAKRFALPAHLARVMAARSDLRELLEDIEKFRTSEGQCLPPSCPLVAGYVRDRVLDDV